MTSVWVSSMDLAEAADVSYRQVDFWTREGLFPEGAVRGAGRGPGSRRSYRSDLVELAWVLGRVSPVAGGTGILASVAAAYAKLEPGSTMLEVPGPHPACWVVVDLTMGPVG